MCRFSCELGRMLQIVQILVSTSRSLVGIQMFKVDDRDFEVIRPIDRSKRGDRPSHARNHHSSLVTRPGSRPR
jgi:hypothetical protein